MLKISEKVFDWYFIFRNDLAGRMFLRTQPLKLKKAKLNRILIQSLKKKVIN